MNIRALRYSIPAALLCLSMPSAWGAAVLTNASGTVQIGVNDLGHLINSGVGLTFVGVGDALTPGCFCEGWGAAGNGTETGWASISNGGVSNMSLVSFNTDGLSATSVTNLTSLSGLQITQVYARSSTDALFRNAVTFTNTSGSTITDVRYSRSMDWDVPPTEFSEYVTIQRGGSTALLFSNDNGFGVPNPLVNPAELVGGTTNTDFVDAGPADHGAFFTFGFGDLAAGASVTFNIFYGATADEASALAALGAVGAEVYSLGQNRRTGTTDGTPATYIFAFNGVGGTPVGTVPEPASVVLMASVAAYVANRFRTRFQS